MYSNMYSNKASVISAFFLCSFFAKCNSHLIKISCQPENFKIIVKVGDDALIIKKFDPLIGGKYSTRPDGTPSRLVDKLISYK